MADLKTSAVIAAAGASSRLQNNSKKQYTNLAGNPLLFYSLNAFENSPNVDEIVLVVPKEDLEFVQNEIFKTFSFTKDVKIIAGGRLRQDSVKRGVEAVSHDCEIVIIHDAARPFVGPDFIDKIISRTASSDCVISAIPVKDTLKRVEDGIIQQTTTRNSVWRAQTPQVFKYEILKKCYEKSDLSNNTFTDEAQMAEQAGFEVHIMEGSEYNFKITTSEDFKLAELMMEKGLDKLNV